MANKIRSICFITEQYPTKNSPKFVFLHELIKEFVKLGIECTVIAPQSILHVIKHKTPLRRKSLLYRINEKAYIKVITPKFFISSGKKIGPINFKKITFFSFRRKCLKYVKRHYNEFDAFYGHFIFPSGIIAAELGRIYNKPSFLAYGENTPYTFTCFGYEKTAKMLENIDGIISVSSANKEFLIEKNIFESSKIKVFPNGVDNSIFYPHDKILMRKKYGLPEDKFIIAFVGFFIEIKGANRLSAALEKLNNKDIKAFYIGKGDVVPYGDNVLFAESKDHDIIPEYLSCADLFVLPTIHEGCCNAIIEAMACGLPIISSNKSFNDDILDESCSIRINTEDINEIADAINQLFTDRKKLAALSEGALNKAKNHNLTQRAKKIINFMEEMAYAKRES